jgi:hypothetical protein
MHRHKREISSSSLSLFLSRKVVRFQLVSHHHHHHLYFGVLFCYKAEGWDNDDDGDFMNMQLLCHKYVTIATTFPSDVSSVCINLYTRL